MILLAEDTSFFTKKSSCENQQYFILLLRVTDTSHANHLKNRAIAYFLFSILHCPV